MVSVMLYPCILCVPCLTVFGEKIRNIFGCGCYFVVECYGSV